MSAPLVSILIPTYEPNPVHLREAIECVLAQTNDRWTMFIHDDASNANVEEIVRPFLSDTRIKFQRSEQKLGIGGNWNACVKHATDPFVQFLFQDDLWENTYLEKSLAVLEKDARIGFTAANHRYLLEGEQEFVKQKEPVYDEVQMLRKDPFLPGNQDGLKYLADWIKKGLRPNIIGEPSFVMLRRTLIQRVGPFNETMPQGLDMEYWVRCLLKTDWCFLPEELGSFRVHVHAASAKNDEYGRGLGDRLRCFDLLLKEAPSGKLRVQTEKAIVEQIAGMIRKFFQRSGSGKSSGPGALKDAVIFCVRHPKLGFKGLSHYVSGKK